MFTSILLTAAFAILSATASPVERRAAAVAIRDTYHGIDIMIRGGTPPGPEYIQQLRVELNQLTSIDHDDVFEISFNQDDSTASNIADINKVECRAYKDAAGVVSAGAPFTKAKPTHISDYGATVSSVLCYTIDDSE
ncbi:uncharacterized protein K489DRAFT_412976 [Dissoconium aciculare CBS 342.82]|uniref:Uncharacterized protein n=1 Tax=Dissoconium aciculare CBS 342.82 TaxID=1314786 RepID=A0A6J3LTD4_9PEZI|nr:uncharacterized protein K489DRAFT_412976 [Dissoconium aciculare CBS 342.82]KAF1819040.1 hypothetical protein K489DRAFT_412976 [Dissoconium aciculare CBS 342.82]